MAIDHRQVLGAVFALTAAACVESDPARVEPEPTVALLELSDVQAYFVTEQRFVDIAADEPGFGGYFVDGGRLVVNVTASSRADAARDAVRAHLVPDGSLARRPLEVRVVQYSFQQLAGWRNSLFQALAGAPGLVSIDLDEKRNRIAIGVVEMAAAARVRRAADGLGLPAGVVYLEVAEPLLPGVDLDERDRPLAPGQRIRTRDSGGPLFNCSLGFSAENSGGDTVLVTNSHCTDDVFGPDGTNTKVYQGTSGASGDLIGTDEYDPNGINCGWHTNCRMSDAAYFDYEVDQDSLGFGEIARTDSMGTGNSVGSITMTTPFQIIGTEAVAVGDTVHKMGQVSGWTAGEVENTCSASLFGPPYYFLMCYYSADYRGDAGDSGGPVFTWSGTGSNVRLVGIHVGDDGSIQGGQYHAGDGKFSPMGAIQFDLGLLKIHTSSPPALSASINGSDLVPEDESCTWLASASGGSTPYSYSWSGALSGTGSSINGVISDDSFLVLTVTDNANDQATDRILIEVDEYLDECLN